MDWGNCIICGKKDGDLKCPADRSHQEGLTLYENFLQNVEGFRQLQALPVNLAIAGHNTAAELFTNSAKWHKACHLKFASSKLERTRDRQTKRKCVDLDERKSKRLSVGPTVNGCLFCSKQDGKLHNCSTLELDKAIRDMATELEDENVLANISGGDLIAIEAKYHNGCLTAFKNRYRAIERNKHDQSEDTTSMQHKLVKSQVFAELVSYIESGIEDGTHIFKLNDLYTLVKHRLVVLGVEKDTNKTRLKNQILKHFAKDCQEQSDGKNTFIVFNEGMQQMLKQTMGQRNFDEEALSMSRVAKSVRKEMAGVPLFKFSGTFPTDCQESSVPTSLRSLVSMLLYGSSINDTNIAQSQSCLTICQTILFNYKATTSCKPKSRHTKDREPPLPLYIGLNVHTLTRSKKMLTQLYEVGLSVSYERILEVEDWLTKAMCQRFEIDNSVSPSHIRNGIFTVGALDNIDHNLSSTTAQGSFHGTSISLFQFPTAANPGTCRQPVTVPPPENAGTPTLPDNYCFVPQVACDIDRVTVPECVIPEVDNHLEDAKEEEAKWVQHGIKMLSKDVLCKGDYIAWAAYHASLQPDSTDPIGISALLPLFLEKAATISMIRHGMTIIKREIDKCNPGQTPVIALDQPLFALAKYVQWTWPDTFGEQSFVVMFGGLHIEMGLWRMVGHLLEGSGWTTALCEADVASAGTSDSFLHVSHLTRTRHAHQVTALALSKLQQDACQEMIGSHGKEAFDNWKKERCAQNPNFEFWNTILQLEILVLIFVRSHREKNLSLFIAVLEALTPWFFALDHPNYARWIPVHIKDMKTLPDDVREELRQCWVFPKTQRKFSAMPLDQAHEQNNALVKETGGAIGLTENPEAFKRWMVAGPQQARLLSEFEDQYAKHTHVDSNNHEQGASTQELVKTKVNKLTSIIASMGNPFMGDSQELMTLDTHNCVDKDVINTFRTMDALGREQYKAYVKDVLVERSVSIHKPIKRNRLLIFKRPDKSRSKMKQQMDDLKSDYSLFSKLFISSQVREADMDAFFSHENHPWPPSLSQHGKLRLPSAKSHLLDLIKPSEQPEVPAKFDAKVFDGPAVVHTLARGDAKTFGEYSANFIRWINIQLHNCSRIDVVWDTYRDGSLKETTREKRGKGVRKKVAPQTKLPVNFANFLQEAKNKEELFALLTNVVDGNEYPADKAVYITSGPEVVSKGSGDPMEASDHEEADSRMSLHIADALKKGAETVMVSTVDTDVVVILTGIFFDLVDKFPKVQLWVAFGKGKHFRFYHINSLCRELGEEKSRALPFFHAFTGSDTTSQFSGKAKKSSWEAWKIFPQSTKAFISPGQLPFTPMSLDSHLFKVIEQFTCFLYDHSTLCVNVNQQRKELFPRKVQMMQNLPPTQAALIQHTNRSLYQASIWLMSLHTKQNVPSPAGFGWTLSENSWKPLWTTLPDATQDCMQLVKCGCKAMPLCSRRCTCRSTGLECTALCECRGNCTV